MIAPNVSGLLAGMASERARVRLASAKTLCELSMVEPELVYRKFDRIAALLRHPNRILQWNGMRILSNLAKVDRKGRLDGMLEQYLAPINGQVMITAAHAIEGGARIAVAKPYLAELITERVVQVEHAVYARPACRDVAIGHALKALEKLAPLLPDVSTVRAFAERQLDNPRPATRKKAERLLERVGKAKGEVTRTTEAARKSASVSCGHPSPSAH